MLTNKTSLIKNKKKKNGLWKVSCKIIIIKLEKNWNWYL